MHVGKKPSGDRTGSPQQMLEMLRLQKELQELVMREEYEMAGGYSRPDQKVERRNGTELTRL